MAAGEKGIYMLAKVWEQQGKDEKKLIERFMSAQTVQSVIDFSQYICPSGDGLMIRTGR